MEQEKGHGAAGPLRQKPDPLDVWFRWIAGLVTAGLLAFFLVQALQIKPADKTSAAHYHPRAIG